ncbi:hypothetical protein [Candidatus Uabimicrobium sp. HlEnr_7]|uniref:hypothetical protein n=1 Tax=Candidatus Uabimicrobium helgolandensis TaxID=3095367 RepID=UPI0035567E0A
MKIIIYTLFIFLAIQNIATENIYEVFTPSGKPAVGAKVTVLYASGNHATQTADDHGKFTVEVTPPQIEAIIIDMPQYAVGIWSSMSLIDKKLHLSQVYHIRGKVVREGDEPVVNTLLVVTKVGLNTFRPLWINGLEEVKVPVLSCKSNEKGQFTLRGFSFNNSKSFKKFCMWGSSKISNRAYCGYQVITKTALEQKITLEPGNSIDGKVVNALTKNPISGATITLVPGPHHKHLHRSSNKDGTFTFPLIPNTCNSGEVQHSMLQGKRLRLSRTKTATNASKLKFVISIPSYTKISGKIIDGHSFEAPLVPIHFFITATNKVEKEWQQSMTFSWGGGRAQYSTKANGNFVMQVPAGRLKLEMLTSGAPNRSAYLHKTELRVSAMGLKNLKFIIDRTPGLLFKTYLNKDGTIGELTNQYTVSINKTGNAYNDYGTNSQVWFYPSKSGEKIAVQIEKFINNKSVVVVPWQEHLVDVNDWPIMIEVKK